MYQRQDCDKDMAQKGPIVGLKQGSEGRERINRVTKSQNSDYSCFRHAHAEASAVTLSVEQLRHQKKTIPEVREVAPGV